MYLKRLEIQGFKSFANKTSLEFEKGITAIVGPNGSGKSNIADGIRWVLGEQSLKQLRGKKSEDVIFAGSEKKTRLSFAEVSVTFDNADRKIPLDYSEVSITRRMDRSGESDYLINGNKVRLLDIVDLVLKSNIGTSRYTVIGQGTIDQMILSGPAEVKGLIDEASGVKTYYIRRDKALKRLEQATQNLMRVQDLLAEIEPRLKSLRRQAKRMQERADIERELKIYQTENFSHKYWQVEDALQALNSKLEILESKRRELEQQIEKQRKNLEKGESDNRADVESYQLIQKDLKKFSDQKNKLLQDSALIKGKLAADRANFSATGKSGSMLDAKTLEIEKNNLESAKEKLLSEIAAAKNTAAKVENDLQKQKQSFEEVSAKLNEIQSILDNPAKIDFGELSGSLKDLETELSRLISKLENASEISEAVIFAKEFQKSFSGFSEKATKFGQNPFADFEKQRKILQELLIQKDRIVQGLNRFDLEKSKLSISSEYFEKELAKTEQKILQVNLDLQSISSRNLDDYFKALLDQEKNLSKDILKISQEMAQLEEGISEYHAKEQSKKNEILDEERKLRANQDILSKIKDQQSVLLIEKAKFETQQENILREAEDALGNAAVAALRKEKIAGATKNLDEKIQKLKNQLDMIGGIDDLTLKEYEETETRYSYLSSQVKDLEKGITDLREVIEQLDVHIKKQFQEAFSRIDEQFQNYFRILFNGGRAYLSALRPVKEKPEELAAESESADQDASSGLADADKNFSDNLRPEEKILAKYEKNPDDVIGIDIKATPPGKKLSSLSALSGGERALTSIALLCALLTCFPSPFVVLDEVDAALDEANTIRFAQILASLADKTQFITVTHNRETMRQAHTLYGITMGDDSISKVLSIKIEQAQAFAK
jgi:chromosome segregation protein